MKTLAKICTYLGMVGGLIILMTFTIVQSWTQLVALTIFMLLFYIGNQLWSEILEEEEKEAERKFKSLREKLVKSLTNDNE